MREHRARPNRREALAGGVSAALALGASQALARLTDITTTELLERAVAAAGGRRALSRARVLIWTGDAVVTAGGRTVRIGLRTVVEPFDYARSESWLADKRPSSQRVLTLDGDAATITRDGKSSPAPPEIAREEKKQYALYGLLRLVTLSADHCALTPPPPDAPAEARTALRTSHPEAPETVLYFDEGFKVVAADNHVAAETPGAKPVAQRFLFSGTMKSRGVRWPKRLVILRDGAPFFDMTLTSFETSSSRPA